MKFYSGFSLRDDEHFFKEYIKNTDYTVSGFSYGAIEAFKDVVEHLKVGKRVDTLQLFSPAFFQTKSQKFKRIQTLGYTKSQNIYLSEFIKSCFDPYDIKEIKHCDTSLHELEELLNYEWVLPDLYSVVDNGVAIEVYLGGKDKIIDVDGAREFFLNVATVTYIKEANHFLQTS